MMSTKSLNSVLAISFALVMLLAKTNANPIDAVEESEIFVCPEGGTTNLIDGVVVFPREYRCAKVGGMCVESDKCRSLVSAKGLCPNNQSRGVECCFELEPQYLPCQQP